MQFRRLGGLFSSTLTFALGVDSRSERILKSQGDVVDKANPEGEQDTGGLAIPNCGSEEAASRASVHGRACHIEGEASHHLVQENAKVVTEERSSNAESPG